MKDVYKKEGSIEKLGRKHAKESKEVNRRGKWKDTAKEGWIQGGKKEI